GHERLLKRAGAERLELVGVEGAEPREQLVGAGQAMIDPNAELVDVPRRLLHRGQILELRRRRGARHLLEECGGDRIDPPRGNLIVREWRAASGGGDRL